MAAEDWIPWGAELFDEDHGHGPFGYSRGHAYVRFAPTEWEWTAKGWGRKPATKDEFEIEV